MPKLTWNVIRKDPELKKLFFKFTKGEYSSENTIFIDMKLSKSSNFEDIYNRYISDKGKSQINIPSKLKKELDDLAKELTKVKATDWSDMLPTMQKCQKELVQMIDSDTVNRFESSKEYKELTEPETRPRR